MALSHSPRKIVPLATGDELPTRIRTGSLGPSVTKRVFFCGVVVENAENGEVIPPDVQDFIASLGDPLDLEPESDNLQSSSETNTGPTPPGTRRRAMTNLSALADIIKELVVTERSYVNRLKTLKQDYADPLRTFARSKDTAILPPYEAKTLFGNIDNLLPVNEAFLKDLESMERLNGPGIGDVALRHFKELRGFEHYKQYYSKREEAQAIFEREMKKSSGFPAFVDRIKYSSADTKNRVGLRELLMEPVQRIPRYTLMFRMMVKHMAPGDPQRALLVEADEIASRIALAETDEQTRRATIMYSLSASIEDFPPALVSHGRRFVDCIDVEDVISDIGSSSLGSVQASGNLHCSLFLFDDKVMIVKRPGDKGGRSLTGLESLGKLAKTPSLPVPRKKSGLSYKGVVDITEVVATDVGGSDFHMYLETPPQDQTDRWYGRPFRSFSVVQPPAAINLNPSRTEADKKRFLENLWEVQAKYRTKRNQSVVLVAEEREVENRGGKSTLARTYFNIYQRTPFLQEVKKTKVVLQIDALGSADPIPFGMQGPPFVVVRVQPIPGDLSRYKVTSSDPNDEDEEDIVQTGRVPERIVQTIHQFGLFKFRTGKSSMPSTPTASTRSRAAIFGLDAISRNLFNGRPGSSRGDIFSGSTSSHRRSKTTGTSGSSIYTQATSTATGDSTFSRFSRASSSTAATSVMDDQSMAGSSRSRSISRSKKLIKRKSPMGSESEPESSPTHGRSRSDSSVSPLREREQQVLSDRDYGGGVFHMDDSEQDLAYQLALARRNSENQSEQYAPAFEDERIEETFYEDVPPDPMLPAPRRSRELPDIPQDAQSQRSSTPRPGSITPTRVITPDFTTSRSRSISHSPERHPRGPRTPSPLPPGLDDAFEETLVNMSQVPITPIPRSKRQPFDPTGNNTNAIPKAASGESSRPPSIVEPLSIKKKASVRTNASGSPSKKSNSIVRSSPLKAGHLASPRRSSGRNWRVHTPHPPKLPSTVVDEEPPRLLRFTETTKEDLESCRRALKRIKLETDKLRSSTPTPAPREEISRPSSPLKALRTPPWDSPSSMTKEAQARMEEMAKLIGKRTEVTGRLRSQSVIGNSTLPKSPENTHIDIARAIDEFASEADRDLAKALETQASIHSDVHAVASLLTERSSELELTKAELRSTKRQYELIKSLLADCTTEKELLFEAFNEELDGMFNDANLPEDEAWAAMTRDLQQAKQARNTYWKENSDLKRRQAEVEIQHDEWGALLRAHGLIPP
ncbi:predicted protein [Sparassis crispa]|uniref:DH domain-containing protein n=1 Tax=Sparassis crispa TaxID=139825 RepID=A0A401GCH2_9APHY|nr:predicted protein [Sparassis crispa]GBE79841.1 predicted protein [Sparassis crispa]